MICFYTYLDNYTHYTYLDNKNIVSVAICNMKNVYNINSLLLIET